MIQQPQPQPHRVKLGPLWTQKVRTWFTLAESSFHTAYMVDSRMKFNLVLAALSEETLDCVKALVEMPEVYEPDVWAQASRILHMWELGDMQPTLLMDKMLALLPNGKQPGILFKSVFLARLPRDMRDHVQARAPELECRNLVAMADNIWRARVARKPSALAAVTLVEDTEEGEAPVATVSTRKAGQQPKKHTKGNEFRQEARQVW